MTHLSSRKIAKIFKAFKALYKFYLQRGFRITEVHADNEFAPLEALIADMPRGPRLNVTSADEHVPEIERRIRVVKERARAIRHSLPFDRIPRLMTTHMILTVVKILNYFPTKSGLSGTWSPRMLMSGRPLSYKKDLALEFGSYCQVHQHDLPRNSQKERTTGGICLGPSGNEQGGFKFMNLTTGAKFTGFKWDELPIPDAVIKRVNHLGKDQPKELTFFDRHGKPIEDDDVETTGVDGTNQAPTNDDIALDIQDELQEIAEIDETQQAIELNDPNNVQLQPVGEDADTPIVDTEAVVDEQPDPEMPLPEPELEPAPSGPTNPVPPAPTVQEPVESTGVRRSTRVRFAAKAPYVPSMTGKRYVTAVNHLENHGALHPDQHAAFFEHMQQEQPDVVAAVMTQLSLKAGLKAWGAPAKKAVYEEMKQLHMRKTFKARHLKDIKDDRKGHVLESHMFLKKKRCGKIKGRTVAGGNKQRAYINKEEASSPTVSTQAVMLSCIIDAEERRDVATIDIPNAFIQTRVENPEQRALIKIKGILVDVLVDIAPDAYKDYVYVDPRGNKVLIVECFNAIYGTMIASLLYYSKFSASLKRLNFEPNDYDPCVHNRIVKGKQQTICFHVDDCKISHVNPKVNDELIETLRKEYESIFEDGSGKMKVQRGKVHEYLGMTLDYSEDGIVKISMLKYIAETLAEFEKIMPGCEGTKSSAAPKDLFNVDEDCDKLSKRKAEQFHSLVAKVLFATKRARPDTGTSISFLMTRTQAPNKDDWEKLAHLMRYIRGTKDLPLTLSANGDGVLRWMIDGSHGVHPNLRGHTGGGLTMGRGYPIAQSGKQKLNTRSSTESELVGVDDLMPEVLWSRLFLEGQGYGVKDNLIYQDNQAAILLEKNGKSSSGKRTKHINARYFFVTDRIAKGDITVKWCPTEDMTGDFWTKPLQGSLFRRFRDVIMGVVPQPEPRGSKVKVKSKKQKSVKR